MHNQKQNNVTSGDTSIWSPLALTQVADDSEYPTKCPSAPLSEYPTKCPGASPPPF